MSTLLFAISCSVLIATCYANSCGNDPNWREENGCCARSWSPDCGEECAKNKCANELSGNWIKLDYASNPYTCCTEWSQSSVDNDCYIRSWSSNCDEDCAKNKCANEVGGNWIELDYATNPFTCCSYPDVLTVGNDSDWREGTDGCYTRNWSDECDESCAKNQCIGYNGWWQDLDFSSNPYTCCPYPAGLTCGGGIGQWTQKTNSNCCIRNWSSECGEQCAQAQCNVDGGNWIELDYATNPYTCCPYLVH